MSDINDLSKKIKIIFAPGCFDDFEGTQEELDKLIKELEAKLSDGSFLEDSEPLELSEEELVKFLDNLNGTRPLQ
jgi:hypothetical protein